MPLNYFLAPLHHLPVFRKMQILSNKYTQKGANEQHRVLLVNALKTRGGEERVVLDLANGLIQKGWGVAISCDSKGEMVPEARQAKALVFHTDLGNKWSLNAPLQIRSHILHWKPSIIHVHGSYPSIHGRVAALGLGVPVIWTVHLHPIWYFKALAIFPFFQRAFISAALRCLNRYTSEVVFVSNGLAKTTNQFVGSSPQQWDVVYNGIDVEKYRPSFKRRLIFRQALGITNNIPLIGVIARITPRKGIDTLLHAIKHVINKEAICIIAGEGPFREEYKLLRENLGIAKRIHFLGAMPSVESFVAALDVGVLASRSEGFPLSVMEMLSAGVPVVLSDIPMHSEFRIASPAVNFAPVDEPMLIAEKIDIMIEASVSEKVRNRAREAAIKYFSREEMISRYQEVYKRHLKECQGF